MSRKVLDTILEDIEQFARLSPRPDGLKQFLEVKYFRYFSSATFGHVFKSMWRVTFKSSDPRAEKNRSINAQALGVIFSTRKAELTEIIKANRDWFSDVSLDDSHFTVMIQFFSEHPKVFPLLGDAVKTPMQEYANLSLNHFASCWFISITPDAHVDQILQRVDQGEDLHSNVFRALYESLGTSDTRVKALLIGIKLYFRSSSFAMADSRFREIILPHIESFNRDHVICFLQGCSTCFQGQATGRGRSPNDHGIIKNLIETKFKDINIDDYPEFKKSLY